MQTDGNESVLKRRASTSMRVDIPGGNAAQPEPLRELGQPPVSSPVIAQERSLELDAQSILAERTQ
jgi:hypothetical protein